MTQLNLSEKIAVWLCTFGALSLLLGYGLPFDNPVTDEHGVTNVNPTERWLINLGYAGIFLGLCLWFQPRGRNFRWTQANDDV